VSQFDDDTAPIPDGPDRWRVTPTAAWNIGDAANGGYALSLVLRAMAADDEHPDPLTVTTHFLRPLRPDGTDAEIAVETVRRGRSTTVRRSTLRHDGADRIVVLAAFGRLHADRIGPSPGAPHIDLPPPSIPMPDACADRRALEQGVELPILDRLDVRIRPDQAVAGGSDRACVEGWIRFADGTEPTALSLPLFADAFPPSLFPLLGGVGWVPTVELTVHVRRHPAAGWVQARLECDDLVDGRMVETGSLWDASGRLVARSRQLGLLLSR